MRGRTLDVEVGEEEDLGALLELQVLRRRDVGELRSTERSVLAYVDLDSARDAPAP